MVRQLIGARAQDVPNLGFCWPLEPVVHRGRRLTRLAMPLPSASQRAATWRRVLVKYAPFALLQVTQERDTVLAVFETPYGARGWKLEGGAYLSKMTPCSAALRLLWSGGSLQ